MCLNTVLQVNVSVHLIGKNSYPVSASLFVSQRAEAGVSNDALPTNLVLNDSLIWDTGEGDIMKTVTLNLPQAVCLHSDATKPHMLAG